MAEECLTSAWALDIEKAWAVTVARPRRNCTGLLLDRAPAALGRNRAQRQRPPEADLATRLILLCHGPTQLMREGGFPGSDTPLDDSGRRKAAGVRVPAADRFLVASERAALETAEAMGLDAMAEASLRDLDFGRWAGRGFAELLAEAPEAFAGWMADPANATPEGEPLSASIARAAAWLQTVEGMGETLCAIAGPSFIRSAIAAAIGLPAASALRIDIAPLSATTLSFNRLWRLQAIEPA